MTNLQRRLKKLEALLTDDAGLVPGSERWLDYWLEQFDRTVRGEEAHGVPLAVFDAIVKDAELEGITGMNVAEEWNLNEQKSISALGTTGATVDT